MAPLLNLSKHVCYEDDVMLIVNKPSGLMVEPDRNGNPNLLQEVKHYLATKHTSPKDVYAQHLHRIDRPVSGLVLFTKDRSVLHTLSNQFAQRTIRKRYKALTISTPPTLEGTLKHWHRKEKKRAAIYNEPIIYTEEASLSYMITLSAQSYAVWDIDLHTGKFHQIRAQLAHLGCPIIGDATYGSTEPYQENAIALAAYQLSFLHPVTHVRKTISLDTTNIIGV